MCSLPFRTCSTRSTGCSSSRRRLRRHGSSTSAFASAGLDGSGNSQRPIPNSQTTEMNAWELEVGSWKLIPMMNFMKRAVFFALVVTLLACSSAPAQSPSDVAARIGNRSVTVKELDERWRKADAADQIETIQKL